jgi:hypothetical protein
MFLELRVYPFYDRVQLCLVVHGIRLQQSQLGGRLYLSMGHTLPYYSTAPMVFEFDCERPEDK